MRYLNLVVDYDTHPKLLALTEVQRWRWTRLLLACVRHDRDVVTQEQLAEVHLFGVVDRLVNAGLLVQVSSHKYRVHDVLAHNGSTVEKRVDAYLTFHPDAAANEVWSVVGGRKQAVLAAVHKHHASSAEPHAVENNGSPELHERFPNGSPEPDELSQSGSPEPASRARGRARTRARASASASASTKAVSPSRSAVRGTDGLTDISHEITDQQRALARNKEAP